MFRSATSYLWGSSQPTNDSNSSVSKKNNEKIMDKNKNQHIMHQSANSLPDVNNLRSEEKEFASNSDAKHLCHAASINSISYPPPHIYGLPSAPKEIVILDKNAKHKITATSSIEFLFTEITHNRSNNNKLLRYPYFIASNRNVRYINHENHETHDNDKMNTDENDENKQEQKNNDLNEYLESLNLSNDEKKGILSLCEWVKTEKLSMKLSDDVWMAEIILSYFSSLSPTNPDIFGCWKKWITYRHDHSLYNVNANKIKAFFDSGIFSVGFDDKRRPVWFINTAVYVNKNIDILGPEVITQAVTLWVTSLLWNLAKNEFDLLALRRGISIYVDLSHWSINIASWSIVKAVKAALVAHPYHLVDIYISNIPTFMYLLKQIAAKVVVPHAMDKFIILSDPNEYFEKYASKHKTPICAGGTLKVSATQWIKDRGFLDHIQPINKHKKSPSSPILNAASSYK